MALRQTVRLIQAMTYLRLQRANDSMEDLATEVSLTSAQRIEGYVFDPNRLDPPLGEAGRG